MTEPEESEEQELVAVGNEPEEQATQSFGRFQLLARLARGGMGDVFLALAKGAMGFNKLVVLKRIQPERAANQSIREMFLDEARLAARLNHPNVVQTNDVGSEGGAYYLAMEYLEGQPLSRLLRRAKAQGRVVPHVVWARIASEALLGLHYAHTLKDYDGTPLSIVHRDVSPHNIFITYEGVIKLVDFGIATASTHSSGKTEVGVLKGKLAYMAPEQVLGEPVDPRTDLFIVGIVLWELFAQQRLFQSVSSVATLGKLLHSPIPRLSTVVPSIDPALDALVAKALEKDPGGRFQTAHEMRDALESYIASAGIARQEDVGRLVSELFKADRATVQAQIQEYVAGAQDRSSGHLPLLQPGGAGAEGSSPDLMTGSQMSPATSHALTRTMASPAAGIPHPKGRHRGRVREVVAAVALFGVSAIVAVAVMRASTRSTQSAAGAAAPPAPTTLGDLAPGIVPGASLTAAVAAATTATTAATTATTATASEAARSSKPPPPSAPAWMPSPGAAPAPVPSPSPPQANAGGAPPEEPASPEPTAAPAPESPASTSATQRRRTYNTAF